MRMYLTTEFDRPVVKGRYYISPGGYESIINGNPVRFDFNESMGVIDKNNGNIVHWELRDLDVETFPESKILEENINNISAITECYVYIGEYDEPEINLKAILKMAFDVNGVIVELPKEMLAAIPIDRERNKEK